MGKDMEEGRSSLPVGTIPELTWKGWGKQRTSSVTTADNITDIWNVYFRNRGLEHCRCTNLARGR